MSLGTLVSHLEKQKTLLKSANAKLPERHAAKGTGQAYKEYLQREIARTERKIDVVRNVVPKLGAK